MLSLLLTMTALAQPQEIPLWPQGNPDGWSIEGPETSTTEGGILRIQNVNRPTVTLYPATQPKPNAPLVLVIPGGGYNILASGHEGTEIAEFLNQNGIHAAVLKYRLPRPADPQRHGPAFQDGQRALRLLRTLAPQHGMGTPKIGVMGFSAGGHLSATLSTQYQTQTYSPVDQTDEHSPKPDFTVLAYPAYLVEEDGVLKPEFKIDVQTPPAFLVHTHDDNVTPLSSLAYATALQKAKVPYSLHLYPQGGHGYGLRATQTDLKNWPTQLVTWLQTLP